MPVPFHTVAGPIDLSALRDEDMTAEIIGEALSVLPRFNGRTPRPWSVAAHSLVVEVICPRELKGWALLHDAHEAYIGDITTPALEYISINGDPDQVTKAVETAKAKLDQQIARAWGILSRSHAFAIRQADWLVLQAELGVFFDAGPLGLTAEEAKLLELAVHWIEQFWSCPPRMVASLWTQRAHELSLLGVLKLPQIPTAGASAETH